MGRPKKNKVDPTLNVTQPSAIKRKTYRYDKLCVYCCTMVRRKNYTRHVKDMHPDGLQTTFVTCLVPLQHLRYALQANQCSIGTQTNISVPQKPTELNSEAIQLADCNTIAGE